MKRLSPFLIIVIALWFLPWKDAVLHAQDLPPIPDPPISPEPRFGAVETYHVPDVADSAGVGWSRMIFYWSEIERGGPDDWNWFHAPRERIQREIDGGREVIGLIQHTPEWAAVDGIAGAGVPRGLYDDLHSPTNYWAQYIRYLITVYGDQIHRWVIWNEPDIPIETYGAAWAGSPADYYQLVKVAYLVAHEVDPDVRIHLGGTTYWHNPAYLRQFLEAASTDPTAREQGYYFDVVTLHIYFRPETTLWIVGDTQKTLNDFGLTDKPIWINETNAPPFDDPAQKWVDPAFQVTQEMQADFLIQQFALALSLDVERISAYKWIDEPPLSPGFEPFGLLRTDRSVRPAFHAFTAITRHFSGTENAARAENAEVFLVTLDRGEITTRIIWSRTERAWSVTLPALAEKALLVTSQGDTTTIEPRKGRYKLDLPGAACIPNGGECLMGGSPIILVEEASVDLTDPQASAFRLGGLDGWILTLPPVLRSRRRVTALGAAVLAIIVCFGAVIMRVRQIRHPINNF